MFLLNYLNNSFIYISEIFYFVNFFSILIFSIFFNNKLTFKTFNYFLIIFHFFFIINIIFSIFFLFYFNISFISKFILLLCSIISYITFITLNSKFKFFKYQIISLFSFSIVSYYLVISDNLIIMFFCYELLMILSIILIYNNSYSDRYLSAMIYFFLWTQTGSFFVLISIIFLYYSFPNISYFNLELLYINPFIIKVLKFFFFIGFGLKVPIFPFYRWLIQIHVEAPSGFSIFLSGFLVKIAVYFYIRVSYIIPYSFENCEIFMILGILSSSIKFWFQTDIKKIVAYATIQEMNMIFFLVYFFDIKLMYVISIFILAHGILSSYMFYLVEIIYKRFLSRNISNLTGVWGITPILAKFIFLNIFIFLGIPGFIKFNIEVLFYLFCFSLDSLISGILFFFISFLGSLGYAKIWLNILFLPLNTELIKIKEIIVENSKNKDKDTDKDKDLKDNDFSYLNIKYDFKNENVINENVINENVKDENSKNTKYFKRYFITDINDKEFKNFNGKIIQSYYIYKNNEKYKIVDLNKNEIGICFLLLILLFLINFLFFINYN